MSDFNVNIEGLDRFERKVERLTLFMQDLRSFWPLVVPLVTSWWKRQFDTEGAFAGAPWAPLSPDYAARKAMLGLRPEILQATGALKQAASRPIRSVTPTSLTLTIEDPKLAYHQAGGANLPARPLIFADPLPAEAASELQAVADDYIRDLLRRL